MCLSETSSTYTRKMTPVKKVRPGRAHIDPTNQLYALTNRLPSLTSGNDISSQRHVRPWSREDYILRLLSFKHPAAWFAKPTIISPLECARHGWCNGAINQLNCISCSAKLLHDESESRFNYNLFRTNYVHRGLFS